MPLCFVFRYRFGVNMGGGGLRAQSWTHLDVILISTSACSPTVTFCVTEKQ